jgi:hypothetical protein
VRHHVDDPHRHAPAQQHLRHSHLVQQQLTAAGQASQILSQAAILIAKLPCCCCPCPCHQATQIISTAHMTAAFAVITISRQAVQAQAAPRHVLLRQRHHGCNQLRPAAAGGGAQQAGPESGQVHHDAAV